jgi:hypothetical protein
MYRRLEKCFVRRQLPGRVAQGQTTATAYLPRTVTKAVIQARAAVQGCRARQREGAPLLH